MKVLIVCSGNSGKISPFINEQVQSLQHLGILVEYFVITGKGLWGYLKNYFPYLRRIIGSDFDLVHAHYGLSGFMASLQFFKPVVVTFHGSDINQIGNLKFSKWAYRLSRKAIFVNSPIKGRLGKKIEGEIIPCGVDLSVFYPLSKTEARNFFGFGQEERIILFSSSFDNKVKNYSLALAACNRIKEDSVSNLRLIEFKGYTRREANLLMNAVDCCLMTSLSEASPQFIKEALATNCPLVSTNVGDVKDLIGNLDGCFITGYEEAEVASSIMLALYYSADKGRTMGREEIAEKGLNLEAVAERIKTVYRTVFT